jgi:hypothetical protein
LSNCYLTLPPNSPFQRSDSRDLLLTPMVHRSSLILLHTCIPPQSINVAVLGLVLAACPSASSIAHTLKVNQFIMVKHSISTSKMAPCGPSRFTHGQHIAVQLFLLLLLGKRKPFTQHSSLYKVSGPPVVYSDQTSWFHIRNAVPPPQMWPMSVRRRMVSSFSSPAHFENGHLVPGMELTGTQSFQVTEAHRMFVVHDYIRSMYITVVVPLRSITNAGFLVLQHGPRSTWRSTMGVQLLCSQAMTSLSTIK